MFKLLPIPIDCDCEACQQSRRFEEAMASGDENKIREAVKELENV